MKTADEQESAPAGNRERCTARAESCPSITCLGRRVPHPVLDGRYPILSCPRWGLGVVPNSLLDGRYPSHHRRYLQPVEVLWDGDWVPSGKDIGPVEVL